MECWKLYDTLTRLNLIDFYKQSCFAAGAKFFAAGENLFAVEVGSELVLLRGANLFYREGRTCLLAGGGGRTRKGVRRRTRTEVKLLDIFVD